MPSLRTNIPNKEQQIELCTRQQSSQHKTNTTTEFQRNNASDRLQLATLSEECLFDFGTWFKKTDLPVTMTGGTCASPSSQNVMVIYAAASRIATTKQLELVDVARDTSAIMLAGPRPPKESGQDQPARLPAAISVI